MLDIIKKYMAKIVVEEVVSTGEYTNEFRVYDAESNFKSFVTLEEAHAEKDENGGTIAVASVK